MSVEFDGAPEQQQPEDFRLERRLFVLKAAAVLSGTAVAAMAATVATTTPAEAVTDRDSFDRANRPIYGRRRVRRVTDRNSYDRANRPVYR